MEIKQVDYFKISRFTIWFKTEDVGILSYFRYDDHKQMLYLHFIHTNNYNGFRSGWGNIVITVLK